ncbi:MAG: hypothetical protein E7230_01995 [Clostridiales bacterium]|nr:hypothetical protein [Clostridiales bacterium]
MKETLILILTSRVTWIAIELIIAGVLLFFVVKNSKRNKALKAEIDKKTSAYQYQELDEMLKNKKRGNR